MGLVGILVFVFVFQITQQFLMLDQAVWGRQKNSAEKAEGLSPDFELGFPQNTGCLEAKDNFCIHRVEGAGSVPPICHLGQPFSPLSGCLPFSAACGDGVGVAG